MSTQELQRLRDDERFMLAVVPTCALDENFVIRAVNHAYLAMTGITEDELLSREVFEVFPENPDAPESDGHLQLRLSGERVMRERIFHHQLLQRYDAVDRAGDGAFVTRFWLPTNRPFLVDGESRGFINTVTPADEPTVEVIEKMQRMHEATRGGLVLPEPATEEQVEALIAVVDQIVELGREVGQLQEALTSRATIDQAKGLIIAEHGCTPAVAFKILAKLSNDTNVRVAEVARALVYRAQTKHSSAPPEHG